MSFSADVKKELSGNIPTNRNCKIAKLTAITGMCGSYSIRRGGRIFLVLQSENQFVMRAAYTLIRKLYHESADISVMNSFTSNSKNKSKTPKSAEPRIYTLLVRDDDTVKKMLFEMKLLNTRGALFDLELSHADLIPKNDMCKRAFLDGMFLCTGTISDPKKSYHLEMSFNTKEHAEDVQKLLSGFNIDSKISKRKNKFVLYIKEGEMISDVLNAIGATSAMLEFENIRVLRDISGNINRRVNCETANIKKTALAGNEQVQNIIIIRDSIGLAKLSPELFELAMLRLENPDMSLVDLGQKINPPIGKSGIYHRFAKIKKIAEEIKSH